MWLLRAGWHGGDFDGGYDGAVGLVVVVVWWGVVGGGGVDSCKGHGVVWWFGRSWSKNNCSYISDI